MAIEQAIRTKAELITVLEKTLVRTNEILTSAPQFEPAMNVRHQLELIKSWLGGDHPPSAQDLERINVGLIAVRNFDDGAPEYAALLHAISAALQRWQDLT